MNDQEKQVIVEIQGLRKDYKTGAGFVTVLKNIHLTVCEGEFISIVGPSGSGKSTLLNMITGIDHPSEGEIIIDGQQISKLSENQLARWRGKNIGVVFQFFQLLPTLTILENVRLPMDFCNIHERSARKNIAMDLLKRVGIVEHAHKLPSALSGGEQQRAAIARALANDPKLIVADEPTGNLDSKTSLEIISIFESLSRAGKTILMVTHDLNLSKKSKRTIHFLDGNIQYDIANKNHKSSKALAQQVIR